jgi:hypothetical protein
VPNHQTHHDQCRILSGKCPCLRSLPCVMACHTKIYLMVKIFSSCPKQWRLLHHKSKLFCFVVSPLIAYS